MYRDIDFDDLCESIFSSVEAGESWLFTQNKPGHADAWANFRAFGTNAENGDWSGKPRKTDWIAHLAPLVAGDKTEFCLWVGRNGGDPIPLAEGRYRLRMSHIVGYRLHKKPDSGSLLKKLARQHPGTTYTYAGETDVRQKDVRVDSDQAGFIGDMAQRMAWHRINHHKFRASLEKRFNYRCAVLQVRCNDLLVASHIVPWRLATLDERVDPNNGLLLVAPLDTLFDRGLISFDPDGKILISKELDAETRTAFGLSDGLRIGMRAFASQTLPDALEMYLARHRATFGFS